MKKKRYDVVTVGSATIDVFVHTIADLLKLGPKAHRKKMIAYPVGTKMLIHDLRFDLGGGGTNTATTFAKMGLKTGWIGAVGKDHNSMQVLDFLKKEKIDFLGAKKEGFTSYSVILDSVAHDRTILTYKGVIDNLSVKDISYKGLKPKWFYFSSMTSKSFNILIELAKYAKKNGIKVAFNPSSYQVRNEKARVLKFLKNIDVLVFNLEEAQVLTGSSRDAPDLFDKIHGLGPDIVLITDGSRGCFASDMKKRYVIKPRKIKVVESTGAGDAFASAFLAGMIKGHDLKEALVFGLTNAESVITHSGAKNKILTYNEAKRIIRKKPVRVRELK